MIFAAPIYVPATLDEALARLRKNLDDTATVVGFALSRSATTRLSSSDAQAWKILSDASRRFLDRPGTIVESEALNKQVVAWYNKLAPLPAARPGMTITAATPVIPSVVVAKPAVPSVAVAKVGTVLPEAYYQAQQEQANVATRAAAASAFQRRALSWGAVGLVTVLGIGLLLRRG